MVLTDRKLRFADAVYAVDATPKTIRNWLARGQVTLASGDHDGGWREFSTADVAVLVIVRKLVEFGLTVEEANDFARAVLIVSADEVLGAPGAASLDLADHYAGQVLLVWRGSGEWAVRLDRVEHGATPPADAYIALHLEPLLRKAIVRAFSGHGQRGAADVPVEASEQTAAAISKLAISADSLSEAADQVVRAASRGRSRGGILPANNTAVSVATPKMEKA